jgi:hypothetical protein
MKLKMGRALSAPIFFKEVIKQIKYMHYLTQAVKDLKQNGFNYYTPKAILDKIKMDSILANPPYKVKE